MITSEAIRSTDARYQRASRRAETLRLARNELVRSAMTDTDEHGTRWTQPRLAKLLGKSAGWPGQLLGKRSGKGKAAPAHPAVADLAAVLEAGTPEMRAVMQVAVRHGITVADLQRLRNQ